MTGVTIFLVVYPPPFVAHFFELDLLGVPISFRVLMVLLALAHFFLAVLFEVSNKTLPFVLLFYFTLLQTFIVDYILFKKFNDWFPTLTQDDLPYENIEKETRNNTLWLPNPPLNTPPLRTPNLDLSRHADNNARIPSTENVEPSQSSILLNGAINRDESDMCKYVNI